MTRQNYYDYEFGETARYIDDAPQQVTQLEERLYDAVYSLDDYISVDDMSEDDALLAVDLIRQNHHEVFYLESANTETSDGNLTGIVLKYRYDFDRVPSMLADYERSVSEALSWTSNEYSEIENAKALHDHIVLHTTATSRSETSRTPHTPASSTTVQSVTGMRRRTPTFCHA